jgi:type I restriction enzyme R subunit
VRDTYGELSVKTRDLIRSNTKFLDVAQSLPAFSFDENYVGKLEELPTPADKAAALEAMLTAELAEDDPAFTYKRLGERLLHVKERQDAGDQAIADRLRELESIAEDVATTRQDPQRLNLTGPGEYGLFTVLRAHASSVDESYVAACARKMVAHLDKNQLLAPGWSNSASGRTAVEQSLLTESWNEDYEGLGFNRAAAEPSFLGPALEELAASAG